jgi:hypothetical protein
MTKEPDDDVHRAVRKFLDDADLAKDFWEKGHDHLWRKTWEKLTSAVGKWLIVAVMSGAAAWAIAFGAGHGWFK